MLLGIAYMKCILISLTVRRIPNMSPEDDQHIVHIQLPHDEVGLVLLAGHGLANPRDVRVVPRVVVHQDGAVGHGRDLVAVVPPRHDLRNKAIVLFF